MANLSIQEIKTIIRGLLISSPEEVTVLKLRRDFKAQEGQDIPFFEFGFHDLTSFLRFIPDVCRIINNTNGPYAIVRLVESVKSAHVSSLVLRQKTTSKGRRRHSSVPSRGRSPRLSFTPVTSSYKNKSGPRPLLCESTKNGYLPPLFNFSSSKRTSDNNNKLPELPVYNSLLPSCNGYANNVESWLYSNEEENALQEISPCTTDVVGNEFGNLEAIVDHHLREILIGDEGLSLKDVEEYLRDVLSACQINCENLSAVNLERILRSIPYIRIVDSYVYHEQFVTTECEEQLPEESYIKPESTADDITGTLEIDSSNIFEKGELRANASAFVPHGNNEKVQRLEQNLYSLMKDHVHGMLGSELKEKYKMKFAAPLNFQTLGCETPKDLAFNMPHIFSYIQLENGDFKLFPSGHPTEQMFKYSKGEDSRPKQVLTIPEITKRNVQWLMQGYPNGLHSKDFEQTYKDTYLESVELKQMGFSSPEEFLHFLQELNIIKIQVTDSDTWLFPSDNSVDLTVYENPLPSKEIIENEVDRKRIKEQFPRDVVGPDLHVKQVEIPSWIMKGSLVEILVQEVNNPHHFWVTFCGEQYSRALDSLMDDLQAFYCSKSHSYRMPPEFVREGQDCVTQYVEEWHRARITSIISATEVEVCFYDYGTRRVVQKDNIHYLHNAHSALPAQAIRAVLANIAPMGDKWTQDASKRFLQLIANKALIGIVISADRINGVFSLYLCDTSGDDDLYIHEVLVSESYAVEAGTDYNDKDSNMSEINDLKTEEILKNESLLISEEEEGEERQPNESCSNLDRHSKLPAVLNSINHDDITRHSNTVQELLSQNSSRKSSQSSLPYAMRKDNLNCFPSISTSVCFGGTSVTSDINASVVTKSENNSSGLRQQSVPPPGFSHISKCEKESDVSDKSESHALSSVGRNNRNQQCETELETPKMHTSNDIKSCEGKDNLRETIHEKNDNQENVKGVSSGVNADFSHVKAPNLQNYYTYPNWPPAPPPFSNFPVIPSSFPSANALAPLPFAPFNMPSLPNPLDFCNIWYYEQCRQQAFLQGMLAHQQMAASAFPPLPPGLYIPQSYSPMSSRNHMNISEVHSPEQSPSIKSNSKENFSACQEACINTGTQTEVASLGDGSDTKLTPEMSFRQGSSRVKEPEFILSSEFGAHTNKDNTYLMKNVSRSDILQRMNTNDDNPDVALYSASTLVVSSEEVITKDIVENSICSSTLLTNNQDNQSTDMCKNEIDLSSQCSVLEDLTKKSSSPLCDTSDHTSLDKLDSPNLNDSQSKIEKKHESSNLQEESTKISAVQNSFVNMPLDEIHNIEVQYHDGKRPLQNTLESQRECNTKSGENGIVHIDSRNIHDLHYLEESETTKLKSGLISLQNADKDSVTESGCMEVEEQEIAQVIFTDSPYEEEIDLHEDDYHEHEMIEKAQQEYAMKPCAGRNNDTIATENISREKNVTIHNESLTRECHDIMEEEKISREDSCGIQSSICKNYSFESSGKKRCGGFERGDMKEWLDKLEYTTDHLLEQEPSLTVPQASSCRHSEISPSASDCYKVPHKSCSLAETLCPEFGALSVSNKFQDSSHVNQFVPKSDTHQEHPCVNVQEPEIQNNMSKEEERIVNSVCKAQTNLSKQIQPVIGAQLSSEVSASFISGPTQPAMSQKTHKSLPTESPDRSINMSCDALLSCQSASWRTTWNTEELSRPNVQRPLGRDSSRNSPLRNLPNQNTPNWHKENSSGKRGTSYQFVKKIYLSGKKIHQINLDGRPYVLTDEIVDNFTPFNGRHVILKILEARKIEINFLELSRRRRPELFDCLDKSDILCRGLNRGPTGNVIGSIHIVPLRSVPYMLRTLNKDDESLSMDVKEEMEKFDPSDPYWSGCCD